MAENEENNIQKAEEPLLGYIKKPAIHFFESLEALTDYEREMMRNRTPIERMKKLDMLRKLSFKNQLLPNGEWQPIVKKITIIYGEFIIK